MGTSRALPRSFQNNLSQLSPQSLACSAIILNDAAGFMNGKFVYAENKFFTIHPCLRSDIRLSPSEYFAKGEILLRKF